MYMNSRRGWLIEGTLSTTYLFASVYLLFHGGRHKTSLLSRSYHLVFFLLHILISYA